MISSVSAHKDGESVEYDVCIVGTGPAGFSLALKLLGSNLRVILLESSAQRYDYLSAYRGKSAIDDDVQPLYRGTVTGWLERSAHNYNYLSASRLRAYGGTSNVWSGWCWPLEQSELVTKFLSGLSWPISYEELLPFFRQAHEICQLDAFQYDNPSYWAEKIGASGADSFVCASGVLRVRILQLNPLNFKEAYNGHLTDFIANVDLLKGANLCELQYATGVDGNCQIQEAYVRSIENGIAGKVMRIRANAFVLAMGALENTRMLLHSGIGNHSGLLGRYFSEHIYIWRAAQFSLKNLDRNIERFYFCRDPIKVSAAVRIIPALVGTEAFFSESQCGGFRILLGGADDTRGTLNIHVEQEPQVDNRISLDNDCERDIFGVPHLHLRCSLNQADLLTVRTAIETGITFLSKSASISDVCLPDFSVPMEKWEPPYRISPGNHPMGTTRMAQSPEEGVVDPDCKVHSTRNLYVIGSSVFPCSGYSNPTLTIVALACRLGEHLMANFEKIKTKSGS